MRGAGGRARSSSDEDGDFGLREDKIGLAEEQPITPPAGDAAVAHDRDQSKLRVSVAARTDERHHGAAFLLRARLRPLGRHAGVRKRANSFSGRNATSSAALIP